jgi:hypothetical protein
MLTKEELHAECMKIFDALPDHEFLDDIDDAVLKLNKQASLAITLQAECDRMKAQNRWIPVTERLPDAGTMAIISGLKGFKSVALKSHDGWSDQIYGQHYFDCDTFITHWRPLPQPPEGE